MQDRQLDDIGFGAQVPRAELREFTRQPLVDIPVAAALPGWVHRARQRVDEGVHVGGVEVVLFVPGGRGQHDVRIDAGGGHAKVQGNDQVQLAFGRRLDPFNLGRLLPAFLAQVPAQDAVAGAQQVLEHVLVALAAGTQQVGSPDEQVAREIARVVRRLAGHAQAAVFQPSHHVVGATGAFSAGLLRQLERVFLQLRRRGQPAHALRAHIAVDQALAGPGRLIGQRRQDLFQLQLLIAPLVGVGVEERGAVHLARRTVPVEAEGQR